MNLSIELLDLIRFLGIQIGRYPHAESERERGHIYGALEAYRQKHVEPERKEEFYTIAMAAFVDGEEEGKKLREQALVAKKAGA